MKNIIAFIIGIAFTVCIAATSQDIGRSLHLIEPVIPESTKVILVRGGMSYPDVQTAIAPYLKAGYTVDQIEAIGVSGCYAVLKKY